MTKAQIRTAVRNLISEQSTDAGALLGSGNTTIDEYIDAAAEDVVLDLIYGGVYHPLLGSETFDLTADDNEIDLTAEWISIWTINRLTSDESPQPLNFIEMSEEALARYSGETAEDPADYTVMGTTIVLLPTPSSDKTNWATVTFLRAEAADVPDTGPAYIPRLAHRLIVYKAAEEIAISADANPKLFIDLYDKRLEKVIKVIGTTTHQPKFIGESFHYLKTRDTRDRAFYDKAGFFD